MLVGGLLLALTSHLVGNLAGRPREWLLASVTVAALVSGSHLSKYIPWSAWQVPRDWSRFGSIGFALVYGAVLGFGVMTMLPSVGLLAVVGGASVLELPVALMLGAIFGLARAVPAVIAVGAQHHISAPVLTVIQGSVGQLAPVELVALAALTGLLLFS